MSRRELDRLSVIQQVARRQMSQVDAAQLTGRSVRQIRRWLVSYRSEGERGLISARRGKPSNNRMMTADQDQIIDIVRANYADFGPTFANEKLRALHEIKISTETLRQLMISAGAPKAAGGRLSTSCENVGHDAANWCRLMVRRTTGSRIAAHVAR